MLECSIYKMYLGMAVMEPRKNGLIMSWVFLIWWELDQPLKLLLAQLVELRLYKTLRRLLRPEQVILGMQ